MKRKHFAYVVGVLSLEVYLMWLTLNQISYLLLKLENVTETAMKLVAAKIRNLVIKN